MPVPASGELSLKSIHLEVDGQGYTSAKAPTNASLKEASDGTTGTINLGNLVENRPDGSAPHTMQEFQAYSQTLTVPSYSSVIADQTLQAAAGAAGVTSGALSFVLNNQITTVGLTADIGGDSTVGTLEISMSGTGDPGTGGSDNSATGYVTEGSTCTLSSSDLGTSGNVTIHVRFRYTPEAVVPGDLTSIRSVTFDHNTGIQDVVSVTGRTLS
tara:strand:- start:887 stop:1528 length:642 start_codon:yes stop_codon:yes gene_type:complete